MNANGVNFSDDQILEGSEEGNKFKQNIRRGNHSKKNSLEARRAIEDFMEVRTHHDLYDDLCEC